MYASVCPATPVVSPWGVLGSSFAGYVPLPSQNPYPIIVYSVASYRPHLRACLHEKRVPLGGRGTLLCRVNDTCVLRETFSQGGGALSNRFKSSEPHDTNKDGGSTECHGCERNYHFSFISRLVVWGTFIGVIPVRWVFYWRIFTGMIPVRQVFYWGDVSLSDTCTAGILLGGRFLE